MLTSFEKNVKIMLIVIRFEVVFYYLFIHVVANPIFAASVLG